MTDMIRHFRLFKVVAVMGRQFAFFTNPPSSREGFTEFMNAKTLVLHRGHFSTQLKHVQGLWKEELAKKFTLKMFCENGNIKKKKNNSACME